MWRNQLLLLLLASFTCFHFAGASADATEPVCTDCGAAPEEMTKTEEIFKSLNDQWHDSYMTNLDAFRAQFWQQHPIIIAHFSRHGGELFLYLPNNNEPVVAQKPPISYQVAKTCSHAIAAMFMLCSPFINNPQIDQGPWIEKLAKFLDGTRAALASLDSVEMNSEDKASLQSSLEGTAKFLEVIIKQKSVTKEELKAFSAKMRPLVERGVEIAGGIQVSHWMEVLAGWGKLVGSWENVYAGTNTVYLTRQNNILFAILAQFMGRTAVNRRLFLFETNSFFTLREGIIESLTRVVMDRALGTVYFDDDYKMDYELMGEAARERIIKECRERGMPVALPKVVKYDSMDWPWLNSGEYSDEEDA